MDTSPLAQFYQNAVRQAYQRISGDVPPEPAPDYGMLGAYQMGSFQKRMGVPNNFDNMVAPSYGLPPDANTYQPDDAMSSRMGVGIRQEDI